MEKGDSVYRVDNLSDIGYEESLTDIIRYVNNEMVIIKDVKVFVKKSSEDDDETIEMIIPDESKEFIKKEIEQLSLEVS